VTVLSSTVEVVLSPSTSKPTASARDEERVTTRAALTSRPVTEVDVLVVGGGPSGAAASMVLADGGCAVLVVDKASFPRDKCCGDGLTTLALRLLERLDFDPQTVDSWLEVDEVRLRTPRGRELTLPLPRGAGCYAAVAKRRDLDHALLDLAGTRGANVRQGTAMISIRPTSDCIEVELRTGTTTELVRARYVVGADGMWSPVRKALGLNVEGYRGEWHAFRQYHRAAGPESRQMWVWFEPDLLPGYAWSFPLPDGIVNVGFGIVRGPKMSGAELAALWRDLLDRPHIARVLGEHEAEGPHRAWPIPARLPSIGLTGPRTFFVGDAATATDPMTGEGIGQALETGILAAEAILEAGATQPAVAAASYERSARAALSADHVVAAGLSRVLGHRRAAGAALSAVDLNDWTRRNFARWMFEDYPRAMLATPHRWHKQMFSRAGAWAP